jgi:hypothetical protein
MSDDVFKQSRKKISADEFSGPQTHSREKKTRSTK